MLTENGYSFGLEIERIMDPDQYRNRDNLAIWGGTIEHGQMEAFIKAWQLDKLKMPYRIWEDYTSLLFEKDTVPLNFDQIQRARIFGQDGDLTLRCDGNQLIWHFIGKAEINPPQEFPSLGFWDKQAGDLILLESEGQYLLWGRKRNMGVGWQDDRVGAALLVYPGMEEQERVCLSYREYSYAGQVQFVWFTGLEGLKA